MGSLCSIQPPRLIARHTIARCVTLLRHAPKAWRVDRELTTFRGHHTIASSGDETTKNRSIVSVGGYFVTFRLCRRSRVTAECAVIVDMLDEEQNDGKPPKRSRSIDEYPNYGESARGLIIAGVRVALGFFLDGSACCRI